MTPESNHIIRKVSLDVNSPQTESPFRMQENVAGWWEHQLLPELQNVFEEFGYKDEIVQIPKLDIVIDTNRSTDWQQIAITEIVAKLKGKISDHISTARRTIVNPNSLQEQKETLRFPARQGIISMLISYLTSGTLPWGAQVTNKESVTKQIAEAIKHNDFEHHKESFITLLQESEAARIRLSNLLVDTEELVIDFYTAIIPNLPTVLLRTWDVAILLFANNLPQQATQIKVASNNVLSKLVLNSTASEGKYVEEFRSLLTRFIVNGIITAEAIKDLQLPAPYDKIPEAILASGQITIKKEKASETTKDSTIDHTEILSEKELHKILEQNILQDKKENKPIDKQFKRIAEEGIYVNNAGLVIAAPFLNALFEKTGLAKEFKIQNINKAVCLAGYIVNGLQQQQEYELLLPKILCGVGTEEAINTSVLPDNEMLSEADEMLKSLIEYWTVLKGTSVDGLRDSFLKRDGKLSFKNNEWLLQVEQKAYDMLLQQIPWNYNWIKLPWMPALLKTEWIS